MSRSPATPPVTFPGLLQLSGAVGDRQLRMWRRPPAPGLVNLDQWGAVDFGDRVRVVAADAAYNRTNHDPVEPAAAAAAAVTAFEVDLPLHEAAARANAVIHQLFAPLPVSRFNGRPTVCVAAADWWPDGRVDALRAGDCDVWVRDPDGAMVRLLGGSYLTAKGEEVYQRDIAPGVRTDREAHLRAHDQLLYPELVINYPLGFSETLRVQTAQAHTSGRLVVATDGWDLDDRQTTLCFQTELARLAARPGRPYPHGDLVAVELL